ncbi:site-specific integrase [Desulfobacula sp.]|uniref:tyrosine-type recombinase/integrase n=1 Tax=Desulfobacula sp. TaxID=2593537 RepID=UPI002627EF39|nr:site-specific integrase [Desulfobacula sp.]
MHQSESEWEEKTNTTCLIDWAEAYLNYCLGEFVKKTYKEKQSAFKRFFKSVDPYLDVANLTRGIALKHLTDQKEDRSGYASNKDRKNLLAGWNWGMEFMEPRLPLENPFAVPKRREDRSPRYIPPVEDFWKAFGITKGQDRVMLMTFLYTACRRGEAFRLKWDDVDFEKNRIRLWTRKRESGSLEPDWLPMIKELRMELIKWKMVCPVKSEYVFVCLEKKHFCVEFYGGPFKHRQHFMKKLCKKANVKPFGFHSIRHLTASILYFKGVSQSAIQDILRHKNPTTTNRYLKTFGPKNARKALETLSTCYNDSEVRIDDVPIDIFGQ